MLLECVVWKEPAAPSSVCAYLPMMYNRMRLSIYQPWHLRASSSPKPYSRCASLPGDGHIGIVSSHYGERTVAFTDNALTESGTHESNGGRKVYTVRERNRCSDDIFTPEMDPFQIHPLPESGSLAKD